MKKFFLTLLITCTALGVSAQRMTSAEYIDRYKKIALEDQEIYGIPASIKLAQAMLESDNGNSELARKSNNHFGIKCKKDWTGETVQHDDDAPGECFRKYASVEDSYHDHAEFLDKSPRYQFLFDLDPTDYKGWAYGLSKAGYATNPRYPELLIRIIEENKLYLLDEGKDLPVLAEREPIDTVPETPVHEVPAGSKVDIDNYVVAIYNHAGYDIYQNNGSKFVVAREGDTMAKFASLFALSEKRLRKFNDMSLDEELEPGDMVYIAPKARRSENGRLMHVVKEGETLHDIAQRYGIRLKRLAAMNYYDPEAPLMEGQQIKLM